MHIKPAMKGVIVNKPTDLNIDINNFIESYDYLVVFIKNIKEFNDLIKPFINKVNEKSIIYICFFKKSSKNKNAMHRDVLKDIFNIYNYKPVRLISINKNYSAMRYKKD